MKILLALVFATGLVFLVPLLSVLGSILITTIILYIVYEAYFKG